MNQNIANNLYTKISELLEDAKQTVIREINHTMIYTYYEIGRMIVEDEQQGKTRAEYGKQVLKELSIRLRSEFGRGFSERNLDQMRQFYLAYSIPQKSSAELKPKEFKLSWPLYVRLARIKNLDERRFYKIECIENNWNVEELRRQFNSALYERLALSHDKHGMKHLAEHEQIIKKPIDLLKDPYILEFLDLPEKHQYSESELEQALINKLEYFLLELGKGFTFVGRQVRFTFDDKHFRVDLVFFNRLLCCFVVIDLKIGELTHQDLDQIQMYVNYYDRFVRLPDENKTIGIVICKDKSDALVEITLPDDNDNIFASRFQAVLPDKQTLIDLLTQMDTPLINK